MRVLDTIFKKLHNKKNQLSTRNDTISEYYSFVSRLYSTARTILFMLLTLFVAIAVIVNARADVHENVIYLFRDFNLLLTGDGKDSDVMDYVTDERMNFAEYKNGLCVVGNKNVTIFTSTGRKTLHQTINYSEPRLVVGAKLILAYDLGGTGYSLYNSTSRVDNKIIETPISGADISDSGRYAIVTRNEKYIGVVNIYSSKSSLIATYEKNKYVTDVSFNKQGNKIAVVSFKQSSGDFESELNIYNIGKDEFITVIEKNALPLQCFLNSDEYVCVIYNNMFCTYDRKGELKNKFVYEDKQIINYYSNDNGTVLTYRDKNNDIFINMFDTKGKMLYNNKINTEIKNIAYNNNYIYVTTSQNVEIHYISSGNIKTLNVDFKFDKVIIKNENALILCNRTRAENYYLK